MKRVYLVTRGNDNHSLRVSHTQDTAGGDCRVLDVKNHERFSATVLAKSISHATALALNYMDRTHDEKRVYTVVRRHNGIVEVIAQSEALATGKCCVLNVKLHLQGTSSIVKTVEAKVIAKNERHAIAILHEYGFNATVTGEY